MISRIRFYPYSKHLSMLNSAPSAAFARAIRPPHLAQEKVSLKLTWPMAYSKKPTPRCMSPYCSLAFTPPLASPSIAIASSLPSPRKSPARTASSAPRRIPSVCDPRPDDFAGSFPGYHRRLALRLPSIAHFPACRSPSSGLVGVFGPALPDTHHLGQRRPASQLERGVFSAFALCVATAGVVSPHPSTGAGLLPWTVGGRSRR